MLAIAGWIAVAFLGLILIVTAAGFLVGWDSVWAQFVGPADLGAYDFAKGKRRRTPNDSLACTPGACTGEPDIALPEYTQAPAELMAGIAGRIEKLDPSAERVDDGSDPAYARYVTRTRLMRYPDTTDIEAVVLGDGRTGLRAYARAQLGRKDLGVNRARLERWLGNPNEASVSSSSSRGR